MHHVSCFALLALCFTPLACGSSDSRSLPLTGLDGSGLKGTVELRNSTGKGLFFVQVQGWAETDPYDQNNGLFVHRGRCAELGELLVSGGNIGYTHPQGNPSGTGRETLFDGAVADFEGQLAFVVREFRQVKSKALACADL